MEFVLSLRALWQRRLWVALGIIPAVALAAFATFHVPSMQSREKKAWVANSVVLIDSQRSALGDLTQGLDPLTPRATVYANLMTSPTVVDQIGVAAAIPGDEIAVSGPVGSNGQRAQHGASVLFAGAARYTLSLDTDETQPLIRVTAHAPTRDDAIALAAAAGAGLDAYVTQIESGQGIPMRNRVEVRTLGAPTFGPTRSGLAPFYAAPIFVVVLIAWSILVLLVSRFREAWRAAGRDPRAETALPMRAVRPGPPSEWDLDVVPQWHDGADDAEAAALPRRSA
jgi:hypothetical protein